MLQTSMTTSADSATRAAGFSSIIGVVLCAAFAGCMSPPAWVSHPTADDAAEARPVSNHIQTPGDDEWTVLRVGGDLDGRITGSDGDWRFARSRVDTPLPAGYPPPTPPGAIELKNYPAVRRAEYVGRMHPNMGMSFGFFSLFQHIKRKHIPMTSPVEMDYHGWNGSASAPDDWTMSFLYRTSELGETGKDGRILVADVQPLTVVSIGLTGSYSMGNVTRGIKQLDQWLGQQDEWTKAGDSRALFYNDPGVPRDRRWMETHIPVQRRVDGMP
jgi:hypothetical protein